MKNASEISRSCQNFPRPTFFVVPSATPHTLSVPCSAARTYGSTTPDSAVAQLTVVAVPKIGLHLCSYRSVLAISELACAILLRLRRLRLRRATDAPCSRLLHPFRTVCSGCTFCVLFSCIVLDYQLDSDLLVSVPRGCASWCATGQFSSVNCQLNCWFSHHCHISHMKSLKFKLENYRSYLGFTFTNH